MALAVAPDHLAPTLSSRPFEAVLFDIDGTLVDSVEMVVAGLADMYERYTGTRPADEAMRALMGMPLSEQVKLMPGGSPSPELAAEMADYAIDRYVAHEALESPFEEAVAALRTLISAGTPVALVTSKNARELEDFIARFPEAALVGAAVSASDVTRPKPAPDPVLLAATRLGVDPGACVFIGDSRFDIAAGRAAGATTVGVLYGSGTREELVASQPDFLLGTPEELREWLAVRIAPAAAPQERP